MPIKKGSEKRISSTSKEAKGIIRAEIRAHYSPSFKGEGRSALANMKRAADQYNGGQLSKYRLSDYRKGAALVDAGAFEIAEQDRMLGKIYGKKNVASWDMEKRHETYKHLIGREYDSMLRESEKKKEEQRRKKAAEQAKKVAAKAKKKTTKR